MKKEITLTQLEKEEEPMYLVEYYSLDGVVKNTKKFNNPILARLFIREINPEYSWTVYKLR